MMWRFRVQSWMMTLVLAASTSAQATTHVVRPGDSVGEKLRLLRPGDTLLVRRGTYLKSFVIKEVQGTREKPILIKAEPGAHINVTGRRDGIIFWPRPGSAHVIVDGFKVTGAARAGILINGSHHITVRNCLCANNGRWGVQTTMSGHITVEDCKLCGSRREHGVYFSTTDHPVARGNTIHDNSGCGVHMNGDRREGGDGMITGALIERNVIYRCGLRHGGAAINMDGVEKSVIRNNLIYHCKSGGITCFHGNGIHTGRENKFYNNTVYFQPGDGRFALELSRGARNSTVHNNIFVGGRGPALRIDRASLPGLLSDRNIYFQHGGKHPFELAGERIPLETWRQATKQDTHSRSTDPGFLNPAKGDFRLGRSSPAVNHGKTLRSVTEDVTGKRRPSDGAWDIGAYER